MKEVKQKLGQESGQANTEYLLALFVGSAVLLACAALFSYFSSAGSSSGTHSSKTYLRAPYCLPPAGAASGISEQWLKDLIIH
ncbi:MAG: hypothetical protein FWF11_00640 [Coriobacteriia bacterium]|nr:hypothetical protein [Coriobacteriia bacterium]